MNHKSDCAHLIRLSSLGASFAMPTPPLKVMMQPFITVLNQGIFRHEPSMSAGTLIADLRSPANPPPPMIG
jgi:hypothetical protein